MAPLVRTGGSRHAGLAAPPQRNIHQELIERWHKAKNLVREYNRINSENLAEKEKVLSELLGGKGKNLWITAPFLWITVTIFILETMCGLAVVRL